MQHYFSENPDIKSNRKKIDLQFLNKHFSFTTDNGIFSKNNIDTGTKILLTEIIKTFKAPSTSFDVLDIGCGYGVVATIIRSFYKNSNVILSDVNNRALDLAKINLENNNISDNYKIINSNLYENICEQFDLIISNPPIRAGKKLIFELYRKSYEHLKQDGLFFCVIMTKHGAKSTEKELKTIFSSISCIQISEGYRVYMGRK